MYKILNVVFFIIIISFFIKVFNYYSSNQNIKNTILNRSNSDEILQKKLINIPILANDTGNVIEFNSSFSKELKIDKQRSFWDLLKNNEKKSNNN